MAQFDRDHDLVLQILQAAGWTITHPTGINIPFAGKLGRVDIGAEIYVAEKGVRRIAVEVKNYAATGAILGDFQRSIGQYLMYQHYFIENEPEREVYKAVPKATYDDFLNLPEMARFLKRHVIKMLVYNPDSQTIALWIE